MTTVSTSNPSIAFLKLLAHELRWQMLAALARSDYRVQELVELVGQSMNLVSYHLKKLREAGLVNERRSSADGRDVYYSLELERLATLFQLSGAELHPALDPGARSIQQPDDGQPQQPRRVLFLCTHNSARSQMAEGLLRHMAGDRVAVCSAGNEPGTVHPLAIETLAALSIDIRQHRSKHLDAFADESFDYIITVCDQVRENCPVFPGDPERIHWSFPDPVAEDDAAEQRLLFQTIAQQLRTRLGYLLLIMEQDTASTIPGFDS